MFFVVEYHAICMTRLSHEAGDFRRLIATIIFCILQTSDRKTRENCTTHSLESMIVYF